MAGWQRNLQTIVRQFGKRVAHNYPSSANFSASRLESSLAPGELPFLQRLWKLPDTNVSRPFYRYLQESGISSSRKLLAGASDEKPIASPLTPTLALSSGKSENQKAASKPAKVQAVLKDIKQSPKKVNLVAALVRGMRVEDALLQLQVTVKRASKTVYQVIHSARANATHNHGLDPDRLLVGKCFNAIHLMLAFVLELYLFRILSLCSGGICWEGIF
ncbi:39S ribosomal protein L22 mitochondrial [Tripterygium wilfordii]|uniref:39S ribosomal protein L22 mitochondrial n=1 Tax=Tripterygium wilfordii TaxID=458696 RepID=A0A7J7CU26_TRIWF|nr:39S ribosomal protein L22 mitochondrial [Tripterygium wilfordii]